MKNLDKIFVASMISNGKVLEYYNFDIKFIFILFDFKKIRNYYDTHIFRDGLNRHSEASKIHASWPAQNHFQM